MRILLVTLAVIVVLVGVGGAGLAAYILTRPHPVISVSSEYHVGSTPAGSLGTVFHVSGHQFSSNSVITFLLDDSRVLGDSRAASDADGAVKLDVTVTSAWAVGSHLLTARDANGNVTKGAVSVIVVPQGQAHTPGPNGAPADDTSFTLSVTLHLHFVETGGSTSFTETLIITARPDKSGGTVCETIDHGQPQTYHGDAGNGRTYTETATYSCSGTYQGGKLSYTETDTSDKTDLSDGVSCVMHTPSVVQHLEGTFTAPNSISGTVSGGGDTADCNKGIGTVQVNNTIEGTWTGQL